MEVYFTTSTINKWQKVFLVEELRNIILASLNFLIEERRIQLHSWVIMPNHLHLIFTILEPHELSDIFRDFHKYTSQKILQWLRNKAPQKLTQFLSEKSDRKFQVWQTTHAPKKIESIQFYSQKAEYIHFNPCHKCWKLVDNPEDYLYSSAIDYYTDKKGLLPIVPIQWQ